MNNIYHMLFSISTSFDICVGEICTSLCRATTLTRKQRILDLSAVVFKATAYVSQAHFPLVETQMEDNMWQCLFRFFLFSENEKTIRGKLVSDEFCQAFFLKQMEHKVQKVVNILQKRLPLSGAVIQRSGLLL